jgi:hypothetical protein
MDVIIRHEAITDCTEQICKAALPIEDCFIVPLHHDKL